MNDAKKDATKELRSRRRHRKKVSAISVVSRNAVAVLFHLFLQVETLLLWVDNHGIERTREVSITGNLLSTLAKEDARNKLQLPSIVFTGVMRDMNREDGYLQYFMTKLLVLVQNITSNFHIIIYENDSNDGTRRVLRNMLENKSYATLILEDYAPQAYEETVLLNKVRTERIAHSRNRILELVEQNFRHFDYFAMMDMDGVCGGSNMSLSYDSNIFKYALLDLKDRWDILTFRFEPYWDLWAFRHDSLAPKNHWYGGKRENKLSDPHQFKTVLFGNVSWPDGLVPVRSAFEMFAIYNMSFIQNRTARYRGIDESSGKADSEHVAFHKHLTEKLGARMRLSPLVYCEGDNAYRQLPENITSRLPN